jgi:hypothetical protein
MDSKNIPRDKKGDIISSEIPQDFFTDIHNSRFTYVFHFKDEDGFFVEVDYEKWSFEDMRTDWPKFELEEYQIFKAEKPPNDEDWTKRQYYNNCLNQFFTPIFIGKFKNSDDLKIDIYTLVIPKATLKNICDFIENIGLVKHKDFILFLIAKIEQVYVQDVEFYDRPEQRKILKEFPNEVKKLHQVLKFAEHKSYEDTLKKPILEQVAFHYNTIKPIKINDTSLLSNITNSTIKYFDSGAQRNWEKQLLSSPSVYDENQLPNQFRHRLCNVLHNFFKAVKAFDFGTKKTTDAELEAIARILDFAYVKFQNNKKEELDIDDDLALIKQHIKNAIKRKEIKYETFDFKIKELQPDLDKLNKHFNKELINAGNSNYTKHDIIDVYSITDRFKINDSAPHLLYVFSCLKQKSFQIRHQFELLLNKEIESNTDYQSWKKLIELIKTKEKFSEIKFKIGNGEKEYTFQERLSFELLEQALFEFYSNNKFEFEIDFYESNLEFGANNRSTKLVTTGKLHQPANRFLSLFCKQCYQFLLIEYPPSEREWSPSKKYFSIIGLLLINSLLLGHNRWDEEFIFKKVEYWYNL